MIYDNGLVEQEPYEFIKAFNTCSMLEWAVQYPIRQENETVNVVTWCVAGCHWPYVVRGVPAWDKRLGCLHWCDNGVKWDQSPGSCCHHLAAGTAVCSLTVSDGCREGSVRQVTSPCCIGYWVQGGSYHSGCMHHRSYAVVSPSPSVQHSALEPGNCNSHHRPHKSSLDQGILWDFLLWAQGDNFHTD